MGKSNQNNSSQDNDNKIGKAKWQLDVLGIFIDLCVQAVHKGLRPGSHLSREGWRFVLTEFHAKIGLDYTKVQLKNKWDSMKKDWKLFQDLMGKETGLGWDPKKNTIAASETWWEEKIKGNPALEKFRSQGIPQNLLAKMDILFMDTIATGNHAWAPSLGVLLDDDDFDDVAGVSGGDCVQLEEIGDSEDEPNFVESLFDTTCSENQGTQTTGRDYHSAEKVKDNKGKRIGVSSKDKKLKKQKKQPSGSAKLSQQIDRLMETVESRGTVTSKMTDLPGCSISEVYMDLNTLPEIEEGNELWLFATELLENKIKREAYTSIKKPEAKLIWLKYHQAKAKSCNV